MSKKSNDNLHKILDFVNDQVNEKGYPPSVREICSAIGFKSTSTVHGYIQKLQKNGMILKDPTKPRALKVIDPEFQKKELFEVPLVGKVTAGQPILAVENIEDTFPLPSEFVRDSNVFMLQVKGDSMIEAGILDNDFVLVRQQSTANNGDMVVALIGDEATVKTFYKENDHIRLQPENQHMDPIIVNGDISILGKITGVLRKL